MNLTTIEQDLHQRKLALDPAQSFIVQAPAGSGKTELIIQRFLTLLKFVKKPEEVLSITFTKKAANEMRARLIKALKNANDTEPESDHAKLTWQLANQVLQRDKELNWNLLSNPNQLRIQTIDSLCTFLTRQLPILSHLGSQPELADQPEYYYEEAVKEVLRHIEENYAWSDAIAKLLSHLDNDMNKMHQLLINLLAKRDQWLPYIIFDHDDESIRHQLENDLQAVISECLISTAAFFPKHLIADTLNIVRFTETCAMSFPRKRESSENDMDPHFRGDDIENNLTAWQKIARLLLTKSFSWRKRVDVEIGFPPLTELNAEEKVIHKIYREQFKELIEKLTDHEVFRLTLIDVLHLPDPTYSDQQWGILRSLLHVLKIVSAQLRVIFQQHGKIDFIENAQAALQALTHHDTPTDLALVLDYQIQHILIDEFQDTSFTQYQLLEKLTSGWQTNDGRTLFVVGDPMQSIYRFREAEVGLFIRMRLHGLKHIRLTPLTLAINFRSTPEIVKWNNRHFEKIFPQSNDIVSGAVTYSHSISNQHQQHEDDSFTKLFCHLNGNELIQANHIIEQLHKIKNNYPNDSIAILVRSRSHLSSLIPALKKANIAYQAVDIDPLYSRQIIQDLLSLTCALLHPADRISWLAVLRAPWCGLTLADLLKIAGPHPYTTIWQQLQTKNVIATLSDDGQKRLHRVLPILQSKIADRGRNDLRFWIESTWMLLGGPACLNDEMEIEEAKTFFHLLEEVSDIQLDKLKNKIKNLYASTNHHASLQIMTIHTAKGLEFDTVILPHLERKTPNNDKPLLSWMEQPLSHDETALLLAPIHATGTKSDKLYDYINRQQRVKADFETDRLLYVAATRAKKRLYLFCNAEKNSAGELNSDSGSFLENLLPHVKNQVELIEHEEILCDSKSSSSASRPIKRLSTDWSNPITDSTNFSLALHYKQSGFLLTDSTPKHIGTVTHHILQLLSQTGIEWWMNHSLEKKHEFIRYHLQKLSIAKSVLSEAVQFVFRLIENTLSDPRGQWILKKHVDAQSEFDISVSIKNNVERIVIDRTFIDEDGIRWIIDYKTSALFDHEIEEFLEKEQEKYFNKMHHYASAFKLMSQHPIRLALYFPALPAWVEWESEV